MTELFAGLNEFVVAISLASLIGIAVLTTVAGLSAAVVAKRLRAPHRRRHQTDLDLAFRRAKINRLSGATLHSAF
jgi:biopolymer transport protein ExbB/TolQ